MTTQAQAAPPVSGRVGSFRWYLVIVIMVVTAVSAIDRANLSVLIVDRDFLETLGIVGDTTAQGALVTFYLLPYALFNVLMGPLIDRFGARRATTFLVVGVASAAAVAGSVSQYVLLAAARAARGLFEAPLFPMNSRYVKNWFPPRERGLANSIWLTGTPIGQAFGIVFATTVITYLGWRWTFWGMALIGFVVLVPLVLLLAHDKPEQSRHVSAAERAYIAGSEQRAGGSVQAQRGPKERSFLRNYRFWLVTLFHVATLATNWGMLAWMPKYLAEARGFDLTSMGFITTTAYIVAAIATVTAGYVSDRLQQRAPFSCITMTLAGSAVLAAALVPSAELSALMMVVGFSLRGLGTPNLFVLIQRIVPQHQIGLGSGIDNGTANLGSAFVPTLIGFLIGVTGAYIAGLLVVVAIAAIGAIAMAILWAQGY